MLNAKKIMVTQKELAALVNMSPAKIIYLLKGAGVKRTYEIQNGRSVCYYNKEQALEVLKKNTEEK